jgi:phenylacetate-CoA ligase
MMFYNFLDFFTMQANQWKSREELAYLQDTKLKKIINHTYLTVPYFQKVFDSIKLKPKDIKSTSDLWKIPLTSSSLYKKLPLSELMSREFEIKDCIRDHTHGTYGVPLEMYFTKSDMTKLNLNWVRPLLANGVRYSDKRGIILRPQLYTDEIKWYQNLGLWRSIGISFFEQPEFWIKKIREYKPEVIYGYATAIEGLAYYAKEQGITDIKPKKIFGVSEMISTESKKLVKEVFKTDFLDIYGAAEVGCAAWECSKCKTYHINADTVIVEFLKYRDISGEGEANKIIVTNLQSYAMPFIRYDLGDTGMPAEDNNLCGRNFPNMKILLGRNYDCFVLPSGKTIWPCHFYHIFSPGLKGYDEILRWKIIQDKKGTLNVFLVTKTNNSDADFIQPLKDQLSKLLPEKIDIKINIVDKIPAPDKAKNRPLVSEKARADDGN